MNKTKSSLIYCDIVILFLIISLKSTYEKSSNKVLLTSILINMDTNENIIAFQYKRYYKTNNPMEGIKEIIKNNQFYINDFAIPGTEQDFKTKYPEGYLINQKKWLTYYDGKYQVMFNGEFDNYEDASFATATGFIAGLEFRLYDTKNDNYADLIEMDYVESFIINEIIKNDDGTLKISRSSVSEDMKWENDGREYDSDNFDKNSNEIVYEENFDKQINIGDIAIFAYRKQGWVIEKGRVVKGILTDGGDHEFYQIGEMKFQDAMRFSRDNIIISNRCGEYLNSHKYFGFLGTEQNLEVSLWFIKNTDKNRYGAPCGFTSGENAKEFLLKAMRISQEKLNSVVISDDGSNVEEGQKYVKREDYEKFREAIARAQMISVFDLPNDIYDYTVYLLYLANYGLKMILELILLGMIISVLIIK